MKADSRWAVVRTRFAAVHRWPAAATNGARHNYLAHPHRHEFHVQVTVEQFHDDRDLEFLELKDVVERSLPVPIPGGPYPIPDISATSCETLCQRFADAVEQAGLADGRRVVVSVSEDGENGAVVEFLRGGAGDEGSKQ